jgi:hypothetical protein
MYLDTRDKKHQTKEGAKFLSVNVLSILVYIYIFQGLSNEKNRLYLDISRSFKCSKSSPVVCLICYNLRSVR